MNAFFKKSKDELSKGKGDVEPFKDSVEGLDRVEERREERIREKEPKKRRAKPELISDEMAKDLFKPSVWQEVGALPFNIRKAMTGSSIFDLSQEQKVALGNPLALIMKMLSDIDPKYLALFVFVINLGSIWTEKEILYSIQKKKERKVEAAV